MKQELIEKRTRNSKTHFLGKAPDGRDKFSWDGTIGSVHYKDNLKDKAEQWKEIDNQFEPAQAPWDWQMIHAGYHIRVKEDFTAGQIIEFEKQGETVQFQPMALEWTNDLDQIQPISMPHEVAPAITNPEVDLLPAVGMPSHQGTIRWNGGYGDGLDFSWRCSATRLIKILEIENFSKLPAPEQFILDGGNPVLRLNLIFDPSKDVGIYVDGELWDKKSKVQTFKRIGFWKDGEELWGFLPLRYWDNSEAEQGQSVATLERRGNKLYISIRVPYDWLQNAVYPVFIDTDVDVAITDGADDDYVVRSQTSWSNTGIALYVGRWSATYKQKGSSMRFTGVNIPSGVTVSVAYLTLKCSLNASATAVNSDLCCENSNNPGQIADYADHIGRTRTAAVAWDDIPAWTKYSKYQSNDFASCVQTVVNDNSGTGDALIVFWEDKDDESTADEAQRTAFAYEHTDAQKEVANLHMEYTAGGAGYKDIATRFKLWAAGFKDTATRFLLWVRNYQDIATRFKLTAQNFKDTATRFKLTVFAYKDTATRFKLEVQSFQDISTRFKLWVQGYKDTATRFLLTTAVQAYKDIATRFRLTVQNYEDVATRFQLIIQGFQDTATRFNLWVQGYQDAATRFKLIAQGYLDTSTRFRLTIQGFKDVATRFRLVIQAYQDTATRFRLTVPAFKDISTRFRLSPGSYADVGARFKLRIPAAFPIIGGSHIIAIEGN